MQYPVNFYKGNPDDYPLTFLQCIELDFDLIIEGVPIEELPSILIEPPL